MGRPIRTTYRLYADGLGFFTRIQWVSLEKKSRNGIQLVRFFLEKVLIWIKVYMKVFRYTQDS